MSTRELIVDFAEYDVGRTLADVHEIRRYNAQRHEMEQLSAIVWEDRARHRIVGYKDLTEADFWVRGHMPGAPLMPGVLMCEAAAQLLSYYARKHGYIGDGVLGFGGLDEVRFRGAVLPGSRLVVVVGLEKFRKGAMVVASFQEFVNENLVAEGKIKGVVLPPHLVNASASGPGATTPG